MGFQEVARDFDDHMERKSRELRDIFSGHKPGEVNPEIDRAEDFEDEEDY